MDLQLSGKAVVVTGASSGVGLEVTRMLLAEGCHVAACARDLERLHAAVDGLPRVDGVRVFMAACDVTDEAAVQGFIDEAATDLGRLDGLVCNAGRSLMARIDDTSPAQLRDEYDLKIFGMLNPVRAARPRLRAAGGGSIVCVNAILSRQPEARLAATSSARAALLNLCKTLSFELAPEQIRVNSVLLGLIDTGQWRRRYEQADEGRTYDQWAAALAADRGVGVGRLGTAAEVAFPIVSLLSPRSSYTTGTTVEVGGGVARYV